jgi:ABC-type glutathione transport system ATPase component
MQIVQLLLQLQKELQLTLLFISHDMDVVRYISNRTAVMNDGELIIS